MGHERWFRGQHDGHARPFDWLTAARQHGIPDKLARTLHDQAMQQAHGSTQSRVQEIYLALLADARRDASRPSPGKVTRTMRLQAERAGKRRPRSNISRLTRQPIAPCKSPLTSYIGPAHGRTHRQHDESPIREELAHLVPNRAFSEEPEETRIDETMRLYEASLAVVLGDLDAFDAQDRTLLTDEYGINVDAPRPDEADEDGAAQRLPEATRARMERAFGQRFDDVIVHPDSPEVAGEMHAFTRGHELHFRAGAFAPGTRRGDHIIAHELAHIVQQSGAQQPSAPRREGRSTAALEADADRAATQAVLGQQATVQFRSHFGQVQAYRDAQPGNAGEPGEEQDEATAPLAKPGLEPAAGGVRPVTVSGPGKPMPAKVQAKMEYAFGVDFSAVRIHEGSEAQSLGALAYTQGSNIHFTPGHYDPDSQHGQELLGHELAHVMQQSQGRVWTTTRAMGWDVNEDAGLEREADELGARAARGDRVAQPGGHGVDTSSGNDGVAQMKYRKRQVNYESSEAAEAQKYRSKEKLWNKPEINVGSIKAGEYVNALASQGTSQHSEVLLIARAAVELRGDNDANPSELFKHFKEVKQERPFKVELYTERHPCDEGAGTGGLNREGCSKALEEVLDDGDEVTYSFHSNDALARALALHDEGEKQSEKRKGSERDNELSGDVARLDYLFQRLPSHPTKSRVRELYDVCARHKFDCLKVSVDDFQEAAQGERRAESTNCQENAVIPLVGYVDKLFHAYGVPLYYISQLLPHAQAYVDFHRKHRSWNEKQAKERSKLLKAMAAMLNTWAKELKLPELHRNPSCAEFETRESGVSGENIGLHMTSTLTLDPGDLVGFAPEEYRTWQVFNTTLMGFVRAHLLNKHVGGPGLPKNLAFISSSDNTFMSKIGEEAVKRAVIEDNEQMLYEVCMEPYQEPPLQGQLDDKLSKLLTARVMMRSAYCDPQTGHKKSWLSPKSTDESIKTFGNYFFGFDCKMPDENTIGKMQPNWTNKIKESETYSKTSDICSFFPKEKAQETHQEEYAKTWQLLRNVESADGAIAVLSEAQLPDNLTRSLLDKWRKQQMVKNAKVKDKENKEKRSRKRKRNELEQKDVIDLTGESEQKNEGPPTKKVKLSSEAQQKRYKTLVDRDVEEELARELARTAAPYDNFTSLLDALKGKEQISHETIANAAKSHEHSKIKTIVALLESDKSWDQALRGSKIKKNTKKFKAFKNTGKTPDITFFFN
jgi:hypothetical protein